MALVRLAGGPQGIGSTMTRLLRRELLDLKDLLWQESLLGVASSNGANPEPRAANGCCRRAVGKGAKCS